MCCERLWKWIVNSWLVIRSNSSKQCNRIVPLGFVRSFLYYRLLSRWFFMWCVQVPYLIHVPPLAELPWQVIVHPEVLFVWRISFPLIHSLIPGPPSSRAVTDGKQVSTCSTWTLPDRNLTNGPQHNIQMCFNVKPPEAMAYVGEMNSADGGDDDEADDEGGDGHN